MISLGKNLSFSKVIREVGICFAITVLLYSIAARHANRMQLLASYCSIERSLCSLHGSLENVVLWSCWEGANTNFLMLLPYVKAHPQPSTQPQDLTIIHSFYLQTENCGKKMPLCWMHILYAPARVAVLKEALCISDHFLFKLSCNWGHPEEIKRFFFSSAKAISTRDLGYVLSF